MNDSVKTLRLAARLIDPNVGPIAPRLFNNAADEIERLRARLAAAERERDEALERVQRDRAFILKALDDALVCVKRRGRKEP